MTQSSPNRLHGERWHIGRHHRGGFTLVEVVVLMSIVALLMTLGGGLLRRLLTADRQIGRALETARQVPRAGPLGRPAGTSRPRTCQGGAGWSCVWPRGWREAPPSSM